jgi:hypothetical protein
MREQWKDLAAAGLSGYGVAGHESTTAYEAGMKPPKPKQLIAPEIETDLSRIQQRSQERDDENWEFRSWLTLSIHNTGIT